MDEVRIGRTIRAIRMRRRWRQSDLGRVVAVSHTTISRLERGHLEGVSVTTLARVLRALDASLDVSIRWHGGDLDRLLNARHSALHEMFARTLARHGAWILAPEVSFNVFGERGVIDVVLWHADRRILVVVELKTEIVDVNELLGTLDRKRRLAASALRARGWRPTSIGAWIVLAETAMNRRRFATHRAMLRTAFPTDGRSVEAWLRDPSGSLAALTFLSNAHVTSTIAAAGAGKRVRRRYRTDASLSSSVEGQASAPTSVGTGDRDRG